MRWSHETEQEKFAHDPTSAAVLNGPSAMASVKRIKKMKKNKIKGRKNQN